MQDFTIIIFILLFFLVLILIFLYRNSKQYVDKTSTLKKRVEEKSETDSFEANEVSKKNLEIKHVPMQKLEDELLKAKEDLIKKQKNLKTKEFGEGDKSKRYNLSKPMNDSTKDVSALHMEVMKCIALGEHQEDVAKKFGIPLNRVLLIIKFDTIKKSRKNTL